MNEAVGRNRSVARPDCRIYGCAQSLFGTKRRCTTSSAALPAQRRLIYLVAGHVRADERFDRFLDEALLFDRELKREITAVLMAHFTLSERESRETLRTLYWDTQKRRDRACGLEEWDDTLVRQMQMAQAEETSKQKEGSFAPESKE